MSVWTTTNISVSKYAITPMDPAPVSVSMDMYSIVMAFHVLVSETRRQDG